MNAEIPVAAAYKYCQRIAAAHYENFTVGSWLLPRRVRKPLAAIYAFARIADDFADEGDRPAAQRLEHLRAWEEQLNACYAGRASYPVFVALADTVERFRIPIDPFRRLLEAFRQDVAFQPFPTFVDLREYCRRSADPVGRLVLRCSMTMPNAARSPTRSAPDCSSPTSPGRQHRCGTQAPLPSVGRPAAFRLHGGRGRVRGIQPVFVRVDALPGGASHARNERTENIGARRLHTVMERLLDQISFDAPEMSGAEVVIDAAHVRAKLDAVVKDDDLSRYIL